MPSYTDLDVLFGRGKVVHVHPGNIRFRNLVGEYKAEFKRLRNDGSKKNFTRKVLLEIRRGREVKFMKKKACDDTWSEASEKEAFNKVHHALRDETRKSKALSRKKLSTTCIQQDHIRSCSSSSSSISNGKQQQQRHHQHHQMMQVAQGTMDPLLFREFDSLVIDAELPLDPSAAMYIHDLWNEPWSAF